MKNADHSSQGGLLIELLSMLRDDFVIEELPSGEWPLVVVADRVEELPLRPVLELTEELVAGWVEQFYADPDRLDISPVVLLSVLITESLESVGSDGKNYTTRVWIRRDFQGRFVLNHDRLPSPHVGASSSDDRLEWTSQRPDEWD